MSSVAAEVSGDNAQNLKACKEPAVSVSLSILNGQQAYPVSNPPTASAAPAPPPPRPPPTLDGGNHRGRCRADRRQLQHVAARLLVSGGADAIDLNPGRRKRRDDGRRGGPSPGRRAARQSARCAGSRLSIRGERAADRLRCERIDRRSERHAASPWPPPSFGVRDRHADGRDAVRHHGGVLRHVVAACRRPGGARDLCVGRKNGSALGGSAAGKWKQPACFSAGRAR